MKQSASVLYFSGFGFLIGIIAQEEVFAPHAVALLFLCIACGLLVQLFFAPRAERSVWLLAFFCCIGCVLGMSRTASVIETYAHAQQMLLGACSQDKCVVTGTVMRDVNLGITANEVQVAVQTTEGVAVAQGMHVLATVHTGSTVKYGDVLRLSGEVTFPKNFVSKDTHRVVPYERIMRSKNIHATMRFPKVENIGYNPEILSLAYLYKIKHAYESVLEQSMHEPASSLGIGITVGGDDRLPESVQNMFRTTGLSHIVVLSGYNIAIMVSLLSVLLASFSTRMKGWMYTFCIIAFVVMTGASAPAVRAGIMGLLLLYARLLHREGSALHALVVAVIVMLWVHPLSALSDVSFQLSVLATLGVVLGASSVARRLAFLGSIFSEIVGATVSALLLVTPLILYSFGTISFIAIFANMIVLPLIPFSMSATLLAGGIGLISHVPAFPFVIIAQTTLDIILFVVSLLAKVPGASGSVEQFPLWVCMCMYVVVAFMFFHMQKEPEHSVKL